MKENQHPSLSLRHLQLIDSAPISQPRSLEECHKGRRPCDPPLCQENVNGEVTGEGEVMGRGESYVRERAVNKLSKQERS